MVKNWVIAFINCEEHRNIIIPRIFHSFHTLLLSIPVSFSSEKEASVITEKIQTVKTSYFAERLNRTLWNMVIHIFQCIIL